ncbi:Aldehyde dehydrogenase family 2 member C4 [Dendrobium catenatum]|uniref:Aldehyde dehydrogenase family 2 member C4 n=1 Tax=Dendrobium catenatum TaxID=906689 RepID=A0A2I0VLL0_9ASPA|nr:Aldehyde dehydrogenase family 2 member C4 [Dendrobium catenatum]
MEVFIRYWKTFGTRDPRTGDVVAEVAEGDQEDVDIAVKAAREAFDHGKWPRMSGFDRGRVILKFADLIEQHGEEIAMLDSIDSGKLVHLTKDFDIQFATNCFRYYAGAADKIHGETLKCMGEFQAYTLKEPVGVVGHIIPWNFPTVLFAAKAAPTLATGCTMIFKPAEQSPLSALYLAHLAKEAGIPDGVINVITGYGPTAGAAISSHMDVDATELSVQGEVCIAGSRIYVQEGIYDEFLKKVTDNVKDWVVGDPFDPQVHQGPQVDKEQFDKVLRYIESGKREGATLLTGGKAIGEKGYYIEPTIFTDVKEDMLIAQDEIFGPVMSIMKFKTIEEAIEKANNTKYGLAAGILTNDLNTANRVSRSIRAGGIWVNCYMITESSIPFGGYKMSGFGMDSGLQALEKYLKVKSVITPIYNSPWL